MSLAGGLQAARGPRLLRRLGSNFVGWIALSRRRPRVEPPQERFPRAARILLPAVAAILVSLPIVMVAADRWAIVVACALPAAAYLLFDVITDLGLGGWFLWPSGLALIGLGLAIGPGMGRIASGILMAVAVRLAFVFAAIAIPGLFSAIVKRLIGRARPLVDSSVDPYLFDPFALQPAYASLPSGHATTAFAAATAIGAMWPCTRPYLWSYAVLIALSRVVVCEHYPSDVMVGAVVGVAGALLVRNWFAARRFAFTIETSGRVRRLPGPSWQRIKALARDLRAT